MTVLAPVLIATDFSPDSEAALMWAGRFATLAQAPLVVLHVVHDPADAAGFYQRETDSPPEAMADVAERMLGEFLAKMLAKSRFKRRSVLIFRP